MDLKFLWAQEAVRQGRICIYKEVGEANFADLMTKNLGQAKMMELLTQATPFGARGRQNAVSQ